MTGAASAGFQAFWAGQALSRFGSRLASLALSVTAIDLLQARGDQVGLLTAATTAAYLIIGLPAGAWIDRMSLSRTMRTATLVRGLALAAVPGLWFIGQLRMEWMYAVALVVGLAGVFADVSGQSYIPVFVDERDVPQANARLEATAQVSSTGAPAFGGLLLSVVSAPVVVFGSSIMYLGTWILLAVAFTGGRDRPPPTGERRRLVSEIADGLRFIRDEAVMRRLLAATGLSNVFASMSLTLMPLLILREIGLGSIVLGAVMMSGAAGGIVGAVAAPAVRRRWGAGTAMTAGLLGAAIFAAAAPLAATVGRDHPLLCTVLLLGGEFGLTVGALVFVVAQVTLRQMLCPKPLLGRVNATTRFVLWGGLPLAGLAAGTLAAAVGVTATMWVGVIGSLVTVLPILGIRELVPQRLDGRVTAETPDTPA